MPLSLPLPQEWDYHTFQPQLSVPLDPNATITTLNLPLLGALELLHAYRWAGRSGAAHTTCPDGARPSGAGLAAPDGPTHTHIPSTSPESALHTPLLFSLLREC